jgi:hypothetical protein
MKYVAERLANLASEVMHERYIARATAAEYLLPEELLEDASDIVRLVKSESEIVAGLNSEAKREILKLAPLLAEEAKQAVVESSKSVQELLQDPRWVALRQQAANCLKVLKFDLSAWEQRQLAK